MLRINAAAALLLLAGACVGASDVDTGDPFVGAPDITGTYDVVLSSPDGCAGQPEVLDGFTGALTVTGQPASLQFDFGDGLSFGGTVDGSFFFELGGSASLGSWSLVVSADGVASSGSGVLEGTLQLQATDADDPSTSCAATAHLVATEVSR